MDRGKERERERKESVCSSATIQPISQSLVKRDKSRLYSLEVQKDKKKRKKEKKRKGKKKKKKKRKEKKRKEKIRKEKKRKKRKEKKRKKGKKIK